MSVDLGDQLLRTSLGSYALYAPVASGGFGTVYFGRDLQSNRAVAIKRLHGHLAYQPAVVQRFQQEAQRLRGLQHPNIVQVLDDGTDSRGLPFIILQWVEGWTIAALLAQSGRFAIAEAVEIACQVLAALEAAGRRGVVHRDIKPANLMLTPPPDRRVKVMDFGIAKDLLANVNTEYTQIGTIAYMAPEQFTQDRVDARTDLYALGVTLYELLAGQKPNGALSAESPTALRELRPEVDPALAAIVYQALEKRPDDRFASPAEMRAALAPFVGRGVDLTVLGSGPSAPPASPPPVPLADVYGQRPGLAQAHGPQPPAVAVEPVAAVPPSDIPPLRHRIGPQPEPGQPEPGRDTSIAETARRPVSEADAPNSEARPPRRRVGLIWAGAAAALAAIGVVVAQQATGGQRPQSGQPTLAPQTQSIAAGATVAGLSLPTSVPATERPRAETPPAAVPTSSPAPTSTAAATATTPPTAMPTVDDLWRLTLLQLDATWSRDWPASIDVLSTFVALHPGYAAGEDKLYAARLFYADELQAAGDLDGAVEQLEAANTLLPQRPEAKQTLVALTPTPTAVPPPAVVVVPRSQPAVPAQPRTQPPPAQPRSQPPPAQPPPGAPPLVP